MGSAGVFSGSRVSTGGSSPGPGPCPPDTHDRATQGPPPSHTPPLGPPPPGEATPPPTSRPQPRPPQSPLGTNRSFLYTLGFYFNLKQMVEHRCEQLWAVSSGGAGPGPSVLPTRRRPGPVLLPPDHWPPACIPPRRVALGESPAGACRHPQPLLNAQGPEGTLGARARGRAAGMGQ